MSYALIDPNHLVYDYNTTPATELGYRVADVSEVAFDVAQPLFWVECLSSVVADYYYYDQATQQIIEIPPRPIPAAKETTNIGTGNSPLVV